MRILITGAAGNLGGFLARHLLAYSGHKLLLMRHKTALAPDLLGPRSEERVCDLADPGSAAEACLGADVVMHFAGKLFSPHPESFLPTTNALYAKHLVDGALGAGVKKFILISFPHVEGPTSAEAPCRGRLDGSPVSVHAQTRLAAERYLFEAAASSKMQAVSLRPGMVYGRDVLMLAFARRLARWGLLGVWRSPTPIHVISLWDFNECCRAAIEKDVSGVFPLGDDAPTTLQEFLNGCCAHWGVGRPWRVPVWGVYAAAWICEGLAGVVGCGTPFTVDFIRIGRVPYFCDTRRMKEELGVRVRYRGWKEGLGTI